MGNSTAASKAYNGDQRISYSEAKKWQTASNVTAGISIGCGVWFVYELVRYLIAANQVLPATASTDNRDFSTMEIPTEREDAEDILGESGEKVDMPDDADGTEQDAGEKSE